MMIMKPKKYVPKEIPLRNVTFFYRREKNNKTIYRIGVDTSINKIVIMDGLSHVGMVPKIEDYGSMQELIRNMREQGWSISTPL